MKKWFALALLLIGQICYAQSVTIDWTNVHQVIDGFGASDINMGTGDITVPSQYDALFFGTSGSNLGLSVLRTVISANTTIQYDAPGDCSTVSLSCAGNRLADIQAANSYGAKVIASPLSPPASYMTNGNIDCAANGGSGTLISADYQNYANWIANFIKSVAANTSPSVSLAGISVQNEPDYCNSWGAIYSAPQLDTFIKSYLGPTLASNDLSTPIFFPESGVYGNLSSVGGTCMTDSACASYVNAVAWHDYDTHESGSTVNDTPYPSGWASGKKFWMSEVSCQPGGGGPSYCAASFDPSMTNGLGVAEEMDQRLVVDQASMFNWWWLLVDAGGNNGEGLVSKDTSGNIVVAQRAYVMGQYARFVRPGYYRIDATHVPQSGITVSAYQNASTGALVIVATNYTGSALTQSFNVVNAPTFTSVTPYVTSATQNIQQQSPQSVAGNSFTYTLPADGVTTFVGQSSTTAAPSSPSAPTGLQATVN